LPVDGVGVPLRRFRKSHHFASSSSDPGTGWVIGECSRSRRKTPAHVGVPGAYQSYRI
jgi:hypothetical protein